MVITQILTESMAPVVYRSMEWCVLDLLFYLLGYLTIIVYIALLRLLFIRLRRSVHFATRAR
jgi:hypothetical protein